MPLYEYKCCDCATDFETLVFSTDEVVECPQCESEAVEKQMSIPAAPRTQSFSIGCDTEGPPCSPRCCRM